MFRYQIMILFINVSYTKNSVLSLHDNSFNTANENCTQNKYMTSNTVLNDDYLHSIQGSASIKIICTHNTVRHRDKLKSTPYTRLRRRFKSRDHHNNPMCKIRWFKSRVHMAAGSSPGFQSQVDMSQVLVPGSRDSNIFRVL